MKLLIAFALVGFAAGASLRDDSFVIDDSPIIINENPSGDESPKIQDEIPLLGDERPIVLPEAPEPAYEPIVLPEVPEPAYEPVDISMLIVPESVINELNKLFASIEPVQFVENSDADEVPVDSVLFVEVADNTPWFEPIAAGELESVKISDEFPTDQLSPETVQVVDVPGFENYPRRYPDPTWR